MYGQNILWGIPHKISYPYIERYNIEILRALRFKSSYAFLKLPQVPYITKTISIHDIGCKIFVAFMYVWLDSLSLCSVIKSIWASHHIGQHRSGSILAQAMACCLMAPSHYLNQCCLFISEVLWHSPESYFALSIQFQNYTCRITATPPRGQWVNLMLTLLISGWLWAICVRSHHMNHIKWVYIYIYDENN